MSRWVADDMSGARTTTTTALLDALRVGDDAATWSTFIDRYTPILQAVARRLGLGDEDAADIAQQTLLEFVRDMRSGKYDRTRGRLRSWIVAIAEHRSRDLRRRAQIRDRHASALPPLVPTDQPALEAMWDEEERRAIAAVAWQRVRDTSQLDERTLRAFELVALRSVPAPEAARECGMSVDHLYVAKHRVAARLRQEVEALEVVFRDGSP